MNTLSEGRYMGEASEMNVEFEAQERRTMPDGRSILSAEVLSAHLADVAQMVGAGDSFEGYLEYGCMEEGLGPEEFAVRGAYRVGNLDGQGGVVLLGAFNVNDDPLLRTMRELEEVRLDLAATRDLARHLLRCARGDDVLPQDLPDWCLGDPEEDCEVKEGGDALADLDDAGEVGS